MADTDPCAEADRLRTVYRSIITGESVVETRFGEDMVKFSKANLGLLIDEIKRLEDLCAISQGKPAPARARAISGRYRRQY